MKKLYEVVDLDVIRFDTEDVLSTSGDPEPCGTDLKPCNLFEDCSYLCERAVCDLCQLGICERQIVQ